MPNLFPYSTLFRSLDPTANKITIDVTSVNDAPSGADKTVTTLEDTAYTFTADDIAFIHVHGNSLAPVTITTLATAGTLKLDGTAVLAGDSVSAADIAAGKLQFEPAGNANVAF